jgi:hypothetical protein
MLHQEIPYNDINNHLCVIHNKNREKYNIHSINGYSARMNKQNALGIGVRFRWIY